MTGADRRRIVALICLGAAFAAALPLVGGFFSAWHPAFDSLAHFRLHLAVAVGTFSLPLLATRFWLNGLAGMALAVAAVWSIAHWLPWLGGQPVHSKPEQGTAIYRLLQINLRLDNPTPEQVLSLIGRERPDVVTLNEISAMWMPKLDLLARTYPHRLICPFPNGVFGVGILSRRPFVGSEPQCLDRGSLAIASLDFGGRSVDVAAIHLGWPWPFEQERQLQRVAPMLAALGETALLAGDLNATPWSRTAQRLAAAGRLEPAPPAGPTWLHWLLPRALRLAGLPIDHLFVKGGVVVLSVTTLESAGSDHWPVLAEFTLEAQEPSSDGQSVTASLRRQPFRWGRDSAP